MHQQAICVVRAADCGCGLFLTADEVAELTGYRRHADQIKRLKSQGWTFEVSATGRPIILRSFAEAKLGANLPDSLNGNSNWTPNLAAFSKAA